MLAYTYLGLEESKNKVSRKYQPPQAQTCNLFKKDPLLKWAIYSSGVLHV